jgi:hypothetical protein
VEAKGCESATVWCGVSHGNGLMSLRVKGSDGKSMRRVHVGHDAR